MMHSDVGTVPAKYANFSMNEAAATAQVIENSIALLWEQVKHKTGIELITEVCIIGR